MRFVPVGSMAFVAVISLAFHWPMTSSQFGGFWAFGLPNSTPFTFTNSLLEVFYIRVNEVNKSFLAIFA